MQVPAYECARRNLIGLIKITTTSIPRDVQGESVKKFTIFFSKTEVGKYTDYQNSLL